jgi:hypothetical protein
VILISSSTFLLSTFPTFYKYNLRYLIYLRDGKKFFAREIRVDKDESWKTDILVSVLEVQPISNPL